VESQDEEILPASELTWSTLTLACYRIFKFLRSVIMPQSAALRALGGIFVAASLDAQAGTDRSCADVMSDVTHAGVQLESLQCWRNILLAEENDVDDGHATRWTPTNITVSSESQVTKMEMPHFFGGF
jgi:hypothetical protein